MKLSTKQSKFLWVTPGDSDGVGPEIFSKVLSSGLPKTFPRILVAGDPISLSSYGLDLPVFEELGDWSASKHSVGILAPPELPTPRKKADRPAWTGAISAWAVETAFSALCNRIGSALVTGPVSKDRWRMAGFPYVGHTDLFRKLGHELLPSPGPLTMLMEHPRMRVGLVTDHLPLHYVPQQVTRASVRQSLENIARYLVQSAGPKKCRITVLGLNPHAGESGALGTEEQEIIIPSIMAFRRSALGRKVQIEGPVSSDGFFATASKSPPDAILAMYHDQGLIPLKMSGFSEAIQITLGLPFPRTSVDHGTAFALAGTGKASTISFSNALMRAAQLIRS